MTFSSRPEPGLFRMPPGASAGGPVVSSGTVARRPATPLEQQLGYRQMIARLQLAVRGLLPPSARVLVISRGDDELLRLDTCVARHFPEAPGGGYAGHHPADSAAAIAHLEDLRRTGAEFLVIPDTAVWWLGHYVEFARHLEVVGRLVLRQDGVGAIYGLPGAGRPAPVPAVAPTGGGADYQDVTGRIRALATSLLPLKSRVVIVSKGDPGLVALPGLQAAHFPQSPAGDYAGHHPADGRSAVAHLEALRARGAEYLIVPKPSFWWFDHYAEFKRHLDTCYRCVANRPECCVIYSLKLPPRRGCIHFPT